MPMDQMPPQGGQKGTGGGDVMKEMASLMMQDAQKYEQLASNLPPELAKPIAQIGQMIGQVIEGMGVTMGGAEQAKTGGMAQNPDVAGTNAQPVTMRG